MVHIQYLDFILCDINSFIYIFLWLKTLFEQLYDTWYRFRKVFSEVASCNIPSDVHLCLFHGVTSGKVKEMPLW